MARRDQQLASGAAALLIGLPSYTKEVRTRLVGLPTLLHRNGLAATLAIVAERARNKSGNNREVALAYAAVETLLIQQLVDSGVEGADALVDLNSIETVEWVGNLNSRDYARVSAHVADAAAWIKRLSEARRGDDQVNQVEGDGQGGST